MKEEALLTKLRDAEHAQLVAEMRRRVAELQLQVLTAVLTTVSNDNR